MCFFKDVSWYFRGVGIYNIYLNTFFVANMKSKKPLSQFIIEIWYNINLKPIVLLPK